MQNLDQHFIAPIRSFNRAARLFLVMMIIYGVILSGWQLFFNFYMLQSGFDREFLGLVNSLPFAAGLILGIFVGRLSDRIGRKPSIMIGISFSIIFMLVQVTAHQPVVIAIAAFLYGVFNMLFLVSQAPLMMKLSNSENRTMLFSLNFGLQTVSSAVGELLAGQLPARFGILLNVQAHSAAAYQAVLITSVLLGTVSLIPLWLMKEPPSPRSQGMNNGPLQASVESVHNDPPPNKLPPGLFNLAVKMAVPQTLVGFGAAVLLPYLNVFYKDRFNISDSLLGVLFGLSSLSITVTTIMGPWLTARLGGKIRAVVATQSISLLFLVMTGFSPFLWLSSVGLIVRSGIMNMSAPLYTAFCMEQTPEHHQGFVNSILNLTWSIGWAVGPLISGIVQEHYGFDPLFATTTILYFIAIVLTWFFFKRMDRPRLNPQTLVQAHEYLKE